MTDSAELTPQTTNQIWFIYTFYGFTAFLFLLGEIGVAFLLFGIGFLLAHNLFGTQVDEWQRTHVVLLRRTFLLGLVYAAVYAVFFLLFMPMMWIGAGTGSGAAEFVVLTLAVVYVLWLLMRTGRGMWLFYRQLAYPFPQRWGF